MTIKRNIRAEITLTPQELAQEFWRMDGNEQATFFNKLGEIAKHRLPIQLQFVQHSLGLNQEGRYAMSTIGNYSEAKND